MRSPLKFTGRFLMVVFALALAISCLSWQAVAGPAPAADAATSVRPQLLMIHGYTDDCGTAFKNGGSDSPPDNSQTIGYLTGKTTGNTTWLRGDIKTVGYYTTDYSSSGDGGDPANCDVNLSSSTDSWTSDTSKCSTYAGMRAKATVNDPIMHLACLFAWYIYDTYTKKSIPVEILAHSMGGLITRAAIGGSTAGKYGFPPPLLVPDVVTVATPHGGIGGIEASAAWYSSQGSVELADMEPGSNFMNTMGGSAYEKPQGAANTHWALIGSSVPTGPPLATKYQPSSCIGTIGIPAGWSLARVLGCLQEGVDADYYPDGDGVVNAMSQMAMAADYKVLYGAVEDVDVNVAKLYVADTGTEYEHEINTCENIISSTVQTCTQPPFYLNDSSTATTKAFVCTSACNATDFSDLNLNSPVKAPHSLAEIASQLPAAPLGWVVGHAVNAGDDYPYETVGQFGHINEGTDAWNEYFGQCDSFAAWKVYQNLAGSNAQSPTGYTPDVSWKPSNASVSKVNQNTWHNADEWATQFAALHYTVDNVPTPGAIVWWPNAVTDPQDSNPPDPVNGIPGSNTGHVGFVSDVYPDGSITVEQYNMRENGEFSVVHMAFGHGYTDNSFGLPSFPIPWPAKFIHVADGPGSQVSPAEPAPGVVQAAYPSTYTAYSQPQPGLTVIGPGDGGGDFTLSGASYPNTTDGWYSDPGHGENGQMLWTNTHHGVANSTATWSPALAPNACYQVDAFVPNHWSNNAAALYTVTDQHFGTSLVPVDENQVTNDWQELGVFQAQNTGALTVELTDQGAGTGQIAADAMRYIQQQTCGGEVRASQTVGTPTLAGPAYLNTTNGWYANRGSGQIGGEYYTFTNGMTPGSSATWTSSVLPSACYEVFAYVPNQYSNDIQAMYTIGSGGTGAPTVSADEATFTDGFALLGYYRSDNSGAIAVELTDQSLVSGDAYVSADTMSFVHVACPAVVEGSTYPSLTEGPGSPLSQFSLTSDWYSRFGHGDLGYEKWTYTHGATAVSTATWTFSGLAKSTTYYACAYIPDNYANNTRARYQGYSGPSTSPTFVDYTNQASATGWTYTGVLSTTSSVTSVRLTLDDTGTAGTYTAADAMRLSTSLTC